MALLYVTYYLFTALLVDDRAYECSCKKTGPLGGGGSSSGRLWNFGLTATLPLTGIVARRVTNAVGCSLLGNPFLSVVYLVSCQTLDGILHKSVYGKMNGNRMVNLDLHA